MSEMPSKDALPTLRSLESRERLEAIEDKKPPYYLTYADVKLLGVVGVGYVLDAYDLFIINPVATMLQYRLYGGKSLPTNLEGLMKASANIGNVIGQFGFGYAGDRLGRKAVYGKELMIVIIATILILGTPTGSLSPSNTLIYISICRILVGIGIGGDYPMSASIIVERTSTRKRGTMLCYLVSSQGWGNFAGGLVTVIVLLAYKHVMDGEGHISKVDGAWRIAVGVSLIPAFGTLYQRLTLPESQRFIDSQKLYSLKLSNFDEGSILKEAGSSGTHSREASLTLPATDSDEKILHSEIAHEPTSMQKADFKEIMTYFSEWRHARLLIGTCTCWFLLDVAFYGIGLNQNVVLQQIGFDGSEGTPWQRLFKISTGSIIVTALGLLPGYYATVLTIERFGRKWLQIQGFLVSAGFLGLLAGKFTTLSKPAFIACFALLQFFINFGANMTIYVIPAELFPTRYRASAHGISAGAGKTGALISALTFNTLSKKIGTPGVLWIFCGCCILGAVVTLMLPEVKGRDPDRILLEELRVARERRNDVMK